MKKYLFGILLLTIISCNNSESLLNLSTNQNAPKIRTLTIQDEEITNGNFTLTEKLDFKFEYNQDKLVKVWDIHGNYTENLFYNNNLLTEINITGFYYPDLASQSPLNEKRIISYNSDNKIIKTERPVNSGINPFYTTFEYPSADMIIANDYSVNGNNTTHIKSSKIFLSNGNVVKIQFTISDPTIYTHEYRYVYDQNINPNSLIDKNRILALPDFSFNIFLLQDYSQISKNNVITKNLYLINPLEQLWQTTNVDCSYQNNNLPDHISFKEISPNNTGVKISAIYGY